MNWCFFWPACEYKPLSCQFITRILLHHRFTAPKNHRHRVKTGYGLSYKGWKGKERLLAGCSDHVYLAISILDNYIWFKSLLLYMIFNDLNPSPHMHFSLTAQLLNKQMFHVLYAFRPLLPLLFTITFTGCKLILRFSFSSCAHSFGRCCISHYR